MSKKIQFQATHANQADVLFLDELKEESVGPVIVMVSRKWDVFHVNGNYMSSDFIVSDEKGNLIHCFSRQKKSHRFVDRLKEGCLYTLKGFKVWRNRNDYRILKDGEFMLEFSGSTSIAKATSDLTGFVRYPFQISSFEELVPTDGKYVLDLIGYVTCVGDPITKSTGATTVEFNFTNERSRQIRVTLWGKLGDDMIKKKSQNPGPYVLILTAMTAKIYFGELGVSSSSSTQLIDCADIPQLQTFKATISEMDLTEVSQPISDTIATVNTLTELLVWGRNKKSGLITDEMTVHFRNTVEITNVRTKNGWYFNTCRSGRCRKGLIRKVTGLWCDGCNKGVDYPLTRFKIELDIMDESGSIVVVLFDEPAIRLLNRTAESLAEEEIKNEAEGDVLPSVLRDLIGSKHIFEIKGHTYYVVGEYEAFNCSQVILPVPAIQKPESGPSMPKGGETSLEPSSGSVPNPTNIITPAKNAEPKKRKMNLKASRTQSLETENKKGKADAKGQTVKRRFVVDSQSETEEDPGDATE